VPEGLRRRVKKQRAEFLLIAAIDNLGGPNSSSISAAPTPNGEIFAYKCSATVGAFRATRRGLPRSMEAAEAATVGRTVQKLAQAAEMIDSDASHDSGGRR